MALCPICKRELPAAPEAGAPLPFCSRRCADVDLLRWLNGAYAIPAAADESENEGQESKADVDEARDPMRENGAVDFGGRLKGRH